MNHTDIQPSRDAALSRLDGFVGLAGRTYRNERNYDRGVGQHRSVSMLSPYIRHRVISEADVLRAVLSEHTPATADKFIQEVFWRTYWKGWLEHRPDVWQRYRDQLDEALSKIESSDKLNNAYLQALHGQTGIEPFDEWATELIETGYLHNHARMWFASIWVFTLKLPWVLGADFFLRHLLDGDPAVNTLSWRWVCGLQTKGKTYLATARNIEKYASSRFFKGTPPAGLTKLAQSTRTLVEEDLPRAKEPIYPRATAPSDQFGLLLTEEDLSLDNLPTPTSVALWMPAELTSTSSSDLVKNFKTGLGQDALARAQARWPTTRVEPIINSVEDIIEWTERHALPEIYTAYLPQGYLNEQQAKLRQSLVETNCRLTTYMRDYDRLSRPHATKGFFQFRKNIGDIVDALDLA